MTKSTRYADKPRARLEVFFDATCWGLLAASLAWFGLWVTGRLWAFEVPRAAFAVTGLIWAVALGESEWQGGAARSSWGRTMLRVVIGHSVAVVTCVVVLPWLWPDTGSRIPWACAVWQGVMLLVFRHAVWLAMNRGARGWDESFRLTTMLALTPMTVWAYVTPRFVGGVDARWYGYVLADFVEQLRKGVFPVLVGQGPYAFNGAVHPYRSAPMFQNLAGVLDRLTGHSLGIFALQHLTVIVCAMAAALFAYWAMVRIVPTRRWTAVVAAAAYATSPGIFGLVATQEMYMSYMAAPWLPLLGGAVVEAIVWRRWNSYVMVALSMAALWLCHSPIALWAGGAAVAVLGIAAVRRCDQVRAWLSFAGMGALTGWLLYFHFKNVSEFVGQASGGALRGQWTLGVVAVTLVAVGLWMVQGWLAAAGVAVVSALIVGWQAPSWATVVAVVVGGGGLVHWWRRRGIAGCSSATGRHVWWCMVMAVALPLGALINSQWGPGITVTAADTAAFTRNFWPGVFLPITNVARLSDLQPGLAAWGLTACALVAVVLGARRLAGPMLVLMAFALLLFPLFPVVSHLWGLFPTDLLVATSGAVNLRLTPAWVTLMCFTGLAGITWMQLRWPRWRFALIGALGLAVVWNILQLQHLDRRLVALTFSQVQTSDLLRTENVPLAIYDYNFLGAPPFFSNGVMDYHDQSRLLRRDGSTPLTTQRASPSRPIRQLDLVATSVAPNGWYPLGPELKLAPEERLRLRFRFSVAGVGGMLILSGQHLYREYILPSSGGEKSFGSGVGNAHDLVVWNSGSEPITFSFYWVTSQQIPAGGEPFAMVEVFDDPVSSGPVYTESLIPYRATITASQEAILETPRRFTPGYRALVNGVSTKPVQTLDGQLGVPVPAGESNVTISFKGTPSFWRAAWVSLLGCVVVAVSLIIECVREVRAAGLARRGG